MPFIIALLGLIICSCQHPSNVDVNELKGIFKVLAKEKNLIKTTHFIIDSISSYNEKNITQSDSIYYIANCNSLTGGIWTNEIFDSARIISENDIENISMQNSSKRTPAYYRFSMPYFSEDKNSFIIYYSYYCGNLCAEDSLRLYKKINGKWTFIKNYYRIVS